MAESSGTLPESVGKCERGLHRGEACNGRESFLRTKENVLSGTIEKRAMIGKRAVETMVL